MRWLFLLLVMLNITYVAWELNRERPQQVRKAAPPKGVEPIILLSELPGQPSQSRENTAADAAGSLSPDEGRTPSGDQPQAVQDEGGFADRFAECRRAAIRRGFTTGQPVARGATAGSAARGEAGSRPLLHAGPVQGNENAARGHARDQGLRG